MKELKRGLKTESLSLRIDPKTKFVLEFMVRVTGLRVTDLIEKAIKKYADDTTVGGYNDRRSWLSYWHPEDGVRTIKIISDPDIDKSYEEDELLAFIGQHEEFFYESPRASKKPIVAFIQVLWPRIDHYLDHWRDNKSTNRWATGSLMLDAIKAADMKGPSWPRTAKSSPPPQDLDDEIPF